MTAKFHLLSKPRHLQKRKLKPRSFALNTSINHQSIIFLSFIFIFIFIFILLVRFPRHSIFLGDARSEGVVGYSHSIGSIVIHDANNTFTNSLHCVTRNWKKGHICGKAFETLDRFYIYENLCCVDSCLGKICLNWKRIFCCQPLNCWTATTGRGSLERWVWLLFWNTTTITKL